MYLHIYQESQSSNQSIKLPQDKQEEYFPREIFGFFFYLMRLTFHVPCNIQDASVKEPPPHLCMYDLDIRSANSVVSL